MNDKKTEIDGKIPPIVSIPTIMVDFSVHRRKISAYFHQYKGDSEK
jgi:hypothetical protein